MEPLSDHADQRRELDVGLMSNFGRTPEGRPIVYNQEERGFSTEYTQTVQHPKLNNGQFTNIPSIFSGRFVQPEIAIGLIMKNGGYDPDTGRRLIGYRSLQSAIQAAKDRTKELNVQIGPRLQRLEQMYPNGPEEGMKFSGR